MQFKRCKPWCKPYNTPNQPSFALKCFLFSKMSTADCEDHRTKQMLNSQFLSMIRKLNQLKRSIPWSFKREYTIFPVPRPSTNPYPPPPDPLQCWYLECAESQTHTKLVYNICMSQFHRKTANIDQGQGELSTYLPHSESAKSYFRFERVSGF